eukprot:CAMPEP_0181121528 /NCGR_PEP_ID=MMETSP1071-20121207/24792_1 /TAXON_ID=35127 /ORGANISM="Thalassiosira sp., Strain NH16" /LENGTH=295 /DNA_ID=CAMNT_0023206365 /DNA_START=72 /DNA_END=959 /DNA_ORIENTATION=+
MAASRNDDPPEDGIKRNRPKITTIIFDVDDTLYDVGTGFTAQRNTVGATGFMVEKLHFRSIEDAQILRDEYFKKFHSTAKALTAAEADGKLPPLPDGASLPPGRTKLFDAGDLDEYWANNLDFSMLGGPDPKCIDTFHTMSNNPNWKLNLVAFSNGPRKYVSRVLREIGLDSFFPPERLFAVTDVLPHCKPDKASFDMVLKSIGARAEETIMVEDSMKNVRAAKALGMRTILVVGRGRKRRGSADESENDTKLDKLATDAEATKAGDAPDETDPAVDAAVEVASEIGDVLKMWLG